MSVRRQEQLIGAVRARCEQDARVDAALMYGSFPKGEGDAYSDVEFYVDVADAERDDFDPEAWVDALEAPLACFVNEYGTRVAIFDDLVRGEFHFEPSSRAVQVARWEPIERPGDPERMVLLDRSGALTRALGTVERRTLGPEDVQAVYDRFLNWWLLGLQVLRRGERARAAGALDFARGFVLQLARAREGNVDHWLTPTRMFESELSREARLRYATCHADLTPGALEAAYRSALEWGLELATDVHGVDARKILAGKLHARLDEWFPEPVGDSNGSEPPKHDGGWRRHGSRKLFESPWFGLRQDDVTLPGGEEITYTIVEHPGYAMVVPLDDEGRVLLERVYRYTVQETLLECPSGGLDGEEPEVAARRELREETGWVADRLTPLGSFYGSDGISDERFHLFLATGLRDTGQVEREPTEQIELAWLPLADAARLARAGSIQDAPSALALILAASRWTEAGA